MTTAAEFVAWLSSAPRKQTFCYHVGSLMADRQQLTEDRQAPTVEAIAIDKLGDAAYKAYEAGLVMLFQTKVEPNKYCYLARKLRG